MPSDSVSTFLDRAHASRLINPDLLEQIVRQPDLSRMSLAELTNYLEQHRVLTPYQAQMIRLGRGEELHFAGYPILQELGPCPGGMAYAALHPSLRTPVVLRRLKADWLMPLDNAVAYVQRARAASTLTHPHLVPLLDAGTYRDEVYVVLEPPGDTSSLESLVKDIGPMPGVLAVDYVRQAAAAIRVVHERGGWHGDVRPRNLLLGPLVETSKPGPSGKPFRRPGPASIARVTELGLVPIRPNASLLLGDLDALGYLPPERLDAPNYSPRGDLYGLGATLFYLLTTRVPFPGMTANEVMLRVRSAEAPPLEAVRPDLPPGLVAVVKQLLAKDPNFRPSTVVELEAKLAPFGRPDLPSPMSTPAAPAAPPVALLVHSPAASSVFPSAAPAASSVPTPSSSGSFSAGAEWPIVAGGSSSGHSGAFSMTTSSAPARRAFSAADKARTRMWFLIGGILQVMAVLGWCYLAGCFNTADESPSPASTPATSQDPPKKETPKKQPPKKKRPTDDL